MKHMKFKCFATKFDKIPTYTFSIKVANLIKISYVAVRGVDHEEGAVQRVLSKHRIADIKEYIQKGNLFFNSFIINWTDKNYSPLIENDYISIPLIDSGAQVIDGQHRLTVVMPLY